MPNTGIPLMDIGKSKLRELLKGFHILGVIKDICDSWEEVSILTGFWKKLFLTLMDGLKVQGFSGGNNCRCGDTGKRTIIRSGT